MAHEYCRDGTVCYDTSRVPTSHHCSVTSSQPVRSPLQNSCCGHSHTHSPGQHHEQHQHGTVLLCSNACECHRSHASSDHHHGLCSHQLHPGHRHIPQVASPLQVMHTPPMFNTPQPHTQHSSHECVHFHTPQPWMRMGYPIRRQLLPTPKYLHLESHSPNHCHYEPLPETLHMAETPRHSHTHSTSHHVTHSPLSSYAQPLPTTPRSTPQHPRQPVHLDFSPSLNTSMNTSQDVVTFQLARSALEHESQNASYEQSGYLSLHGHHEHLTGNPQIVLASRPLPTPTLIVERLPQSVIPSARGHPARGLQSNETTEDPLAGNGAEYKPVAPVVPHNASGRVASCDPTTESAPRKQEISAVGAHKRRHRARRKRSSRDCNSAATSTDTESDGGGTDKLGSSVQDKKLDSAGVPNRTLRSRTRKLRVIVIASETEDTQSETEFRAPPRKVYPLRSRHPSGQEAVKSERVAGSERQNETERKEQLTAKSHSKCKEPQKLNPISKHPHPCPRKPDAITISTESEGTQFEPESQKNTYPLRSRSQETINEGPAVTTTDSESESTLVRRSKRLRQRHALYNLSDTEDTELEEEKIREKRKLVPRDREKESKQEGSSTKVRGEKREEDGGGGEAPEDTPEVVEEELLSQHVGGDETCAKQTEGKRERAKARKPVVLSNWYFKMVGEGIMILEGSKENDTAGLVWHSGPVVSRLSARELATKSGAIYRLSGEMDREGLARAGVRSEKIVESFRKGFPEDWAELIERHVAEGKGDLESEKLEIAEVKPKVKSEPVEFKTPTATTAEEFLSSLKRSSRGRILKPTISPFLNLSYTYDMCGSFEGLASPVIDLTGDMNFNGSFEIERRPKKEEKSEKVQREDKHKPKPKDVNRSASKRKTRRVIPLALKKKKIQVVLSSVEVKVSSTKTVVEVGETQKSVRFAQEGSNHEESRSEPRGRKKVGVVLKQGLSEPSEQRTLGEGEVTEWTAQDIKNLKRIVCAVPAMTTNFWEVVARRLATGHSARDCSEQYLTTATRGGRRRRQKQPQHPPATRNTVPPSDDAPPITARAGTQKRKRQLRDALERMDQGYSDDIFDSTPFRKKMKRVQLQDLSDDGFSEGEEGAICTPSETRRRLGAPSSHTPKLSDYLTTPDLKGGLRREAADNVMYKIQRAKKCPKLPSKKSVGCQRTGKSQLPAHGPMLRNIRNGEIITYRVFEDSDDNSTDSNPFSEIEESYHDIITRLH